MKYISTRGQSPALTFSEILLGGLAPDGGLYLPESYPHFTDADLTAMRGMNYRDLAFAILSRLIDDIPAADLKAIVDKTWEEIGSVFTAANYATSQTVTVANFGYDDVTQAQFLLDSAKAGEPRSFLVGNGYLKSLRDDAKIYGSLNPAANAVVTTGSIGQVAGMDIYQWNQIPANGENLAGVAMGPDSLLVATGIPMAEIAGFTSSVSTAESGLSVQVLVGQAETGNIRCIAQILVGANKGRSTSLVRYVTA